MILEIIADHYLIFATLFMQLRGILGSPVHLLKTVMNLVSNAAEAMPDGGKIKIETKNKYIDLPIKDMMM